MDLQNEINEVYLQFFGLMSEDLILPALPIGPGGPGLPGGHVIQPPFSAVVGGGLGLASCPFLPSIPSCPSGPASPGCPLGPGGPGGH